MTVKKESAINIKISLGENKVPERITWSAPDQNQYDQAAKAMLLSFFDEQSKDTLKIDLWTHEMQIGEMDRFYFQTLRALSETYFKATNNHILARALQDFTQYFGEETGTIDKKP